MRHQLRARQAIDVLQAQNNSQLTPEQMAAYVRQSSDQSVKNNVESVGLQLSAAQQYAVSQGLDADKIVVAHEGDGKRGVSASNLRIDQREKLQEIIQDIIAGRIKIVWAYTHSRLFRDPFGIQSGTFMEICAKHHVKVVIDKRVYDFNDDNDRFIFGIEVAVAARENRERAKWMTEAKQRKTLRGEYTGQVLTPGFIVDRDKASPTYGKFIPYEPHAKVTAQLFSKYHHQYRKQLNLLAAEVARMPFVYPDFGPEVDPRDIAQFRLKKVPGGYTMDRDTLRHLLTAVEVVGYWKVTEEAEEVEVTRTKDTSKGAKGTTYTVKKYYRRLLTNEDGTPKQNHTGIVSMDDFLVAFNDLSWDALDGEDNKERYNARATWKPVKKDRVEPLLVGMLSTPGGTVQYTTGFFKVTEMRPGHMDMSAALQVKADIVDRLFLCRLQDRYVEHGQEMYDRVFEELKRVQANNAQSLVSVDEQIKNYQQSIKNKQEGLATLAATFGANLDKGTAQKLNEAIKHEEGQLNDLLAKKNAAETEESRLRELCEKIDDVLTGTCDCDTTRRFIKLATDRIELAECSAHFATLTVYWGDPFSQVDVCYIWLKDGVHEYWKQEELDQLRALYPTADRLELLQALPTRSWSSIQAVANDRGMKRYTYKNSSDLPLQLALKDQEIIDLLGFHPGNGYDSTNLWVKNVSAESLTRCC